MKRFFLILAFNVAIVATASAQNNIFQAVIGPYIDESGALMISDPSTTIVVDVTVEKEQVVVGPYARYAQKYLDTRGSLVEKSTYSVSDIKLAVAPDATPYLAQCIAPTATTVASHINPEGEFAKVLPDRMSTTAVGLEEAAAQAAQALFRIRKQRMELITGDAGENVFGGGLKEALETLSTKEQEYLELFLGKRIVTTQTYRYTIPMMVGQEEYQIAKFSAANGLQPLSAASGEPVKLVVKASAAAPKLNSIAEVDSRDKTAIQVRLANIANCELFVGANVVGSSQLPVFELGRTAYIANTVVRK